MPETEQSLAALHKDARAIFSEALEACRIEPVFKQRVRCEGTTLIVKHSPVMHSAGGHSSATERPIPTSRIELSGYRRVLVIALGKAAVPMTQALLEILPRRRRVHGICSGPVRPERRSWRIRYYAGGHPLPNEDSFRAARNALRLLRRASEHTFVIYLISGGGSTLFDLPLDPAISLSDAIAFHEALIGSGATIAEINTLRKHFSAVKGGRLAAAAPRAHKLTLQVLDVPWRHMDAVASGPTLPDPSTVDDCRELLTRYRLLEKFPPSVRSFFSRLDLPETPGDKAAMKRLTELREAARKTGQKGFLLATSRRPEDPQPTQLWTLLSNHDLVRAAQEKAKALGYEVFVDNGCDDWPYDKAAAYLIDRLVELRRQHAGKRLCLLSGGEVTVQIDRLPGTGGRNQQFALACALLLDRQLPGERVVCLSAGSDGADGNSPAAGGLVDTTTVSRAQAFGHDTAAALTVFDACPLLTALGDTVVTGPTGNNLRDVRILLGL